MAVKRGVSLYSYQQAYYKRELDLEGCIREAARTGAKGIELIPEQMPVGALYPQLNDGDVDKWLGWMDQYEVEPTCMDAFDDFMMYKDRISTLEEQVQMMARDLRLASRLGFKCIRVLCLVRPEVMEAALPYAEYYNVKMGLEIHQPMLLDSPWVHQFFELSDKHKTPYIGIIPDFGIFNNRPLTVQIQNEVRHGADYDRLETMSREFAKDGNLARVKEHGRSIGATDQELQFMDQATGMIQYNDPQVLSKYKDYIMHFHGKFYDMTPDYIEPTINYTDPVNILRQCGWDGYISSEYEGQRYFHGQDCPVEADEIEMVRRHHVMLSRLIGE